MAKAWKESIKLKHVKSHHKTKLTSKTESVLKLVLNNRTLAPSLFDSKIKSFFMFFFIGVVLWVAK